MSWGDVTPQRSSEFLRPFANNDPDRFLNAFAEIDTGIAWLVAAGHMRHR